LSKKRLTHLTQRGEAHMVEVGKKAETRREAVASCAVCMQATTLRALQAGQIEKGDALAVARVAGLAAAKRTPELIPLCHPVRTTGAEIALAIDAALPGVRVRATVRAHDRTGVEMEALTAASIAALTIYDMCKAIDRGMRITDLQLEAKSGGRSGSWRR
jgi:cyclic pyranopterin phosphate synthase